MGTFLDVLQLISDKAAGVTATKLQWHYGSSFTKQLTRYHTPHHGRHSSNRALTGFYVKLTYFWKRKYNAELFNQVWCYQNSSVEIFFIFLFIFFSCFPPTFSLTYYQRGHRHLRFTLSSDVVDKSDADLIARHFHLFILFSIFRNGIH